MGCYFIFSLSNSNKSKGEKRETCDSESPKPESAMQFELIWTVWHAARLIQDRQMKDGVEYWWLGLHKSWIFVLFWRGSERAKKLLDYRQTHHPQRNKSAMATTINGNFELIMVFNQEVHIVAKFWMIGSLLAHFWTQYCRWGILLPFTNIVPSVLK